MQTYHRLTICHFGFICHRVQLGLASTYTLDICHPTQIYSAVAYCIIISIPKHPSSSIQVKLTILNLTIVLLYCIATFVLYTESLYTAASPAALGNLKCGHPKQDSTVRVPSGQANPREKITQKGELKLRNPPQ